MPKPENAMQGLANGVAAMFFATVLILIGIAVAAVMSGGGRVLVAVIGLPVAAGVIVYMAMAGSRATHHPHDVMRPRLDDRRAHRVDVQPRVDQRA